MKFTRFTFYSLLMTVVFVVGCETPPPAQDPLAGWKWIGTYDPAMADFIKQTTGKKDALGKVMTTTPAEYERYAKECPFGSAVVDDYQTFIKKKKLGWIKSYEFFDDGTGQHAVRLAAGTDGTYSTHILVYDSSGQRVRVISYVTGHYRC